MGRKKKEDTPRITPGRTKNALGVAKVLGPAILPMMAPYAIQGAAVLRESVDRARARRVGVDVADLSRFTGKGAALHARIAGIERGLQDLAKNAGAEEDTRFITTCQSTLDNLTTAVRAAETMPAGRRKSAHQAIARELDPEEGELLRRLGVGSSSVPR